jgi:hypothetical protein
MKSFQLHWDRDVDGHFILQFQRFLVVALAKTVWYLLTRERSHV